MNKIKIVIIIFALIWVIYELDYRAAKLEYVGKAILDHPFPIPGICIPIQGKHLKKTLDESLSFDDLKVYVKDFSHGNINYEIRWIKDFSLDKDAWYYMGYGREIKKVTYYYHSRYFNHLNDSSLFEILSLSTIPADTRSVIIYKCNVNLIPDVPDNI